MLSTLRSGRFRRRSRMGALAACVALVAVASGAAAQSTTAPAKRVVVRVAFNGSENNITPFTTTSGAFPYTHDIVSLIYDSLFWSQIDENPEPWLADSATPSDDFRTWTVKLHPGVLWQDGQPLTADDVKFTFDYFLKYTALSGRYGHHVSDAPPFDHAVVTDPLTVQIFYKAPAPTFKILPGGDLPILPQHIWQNVAEPKKFADLPVGSGPFKLTNIVPDQSYTFVANPTYFKGKPTVDQMDVSIVKDSNAAFQALSTGQVDFVTRTVPPELLDQFSHSPGIEVLKASKYQSPQLYFNSLKAPLSDGRVRKAISLGINNQALVDTILLGHARAGVDSFVHPDSPWALPGDTHQYDPARAQKMLDDAGFSAKDPDGIRKSADGKRMEYSVLVSALEPLNIRAVQLVAQQLGPIGVKLNVESLDPATISQRRSAPPGTLPTYDMYVSTLDTHAHVDPDGLYYFFHSPGPKGFGSAITGYTNAEFDRLTEQATTLDPVARKPILQQAERIFASEPPIIVFWYPEENYAFRTAAYTGWKADPGQGIFTKRSFLAEYASRPTGSTSGSGSSSSSGAGVVVGLVAAAVVVGLGVFLVGRRRRSAAALEE